MSTFRLGTRGSLLAWTQAEHARRMLAERFPEDSFELVKITTRGDRDHQTSLVNMSGTGLFTKELEEALLDGRIDFAVHSLKDVPYEVASGCMLAAFLERESPWDALLTPHASWEALPEGAVIGTSSPRRIAQLRAARPDLCFADLRGNLDTRLKRLEAGDFDAIVLAEAGLVRLGWQTKIRQALSPEICVPAFGQGILTAECRAGDERVQRVLKSADVPAVRRAAELERHLMLAMGGGCKTALGALCLPRDGGWMLCVNVGDPRQGKVLRRVWEGADDRADAAVESLAVELLKTASESGLVWA